MKQLLLALAILSCAVHDGSAQEMKLEINEQRQQTIEEIARVSAAINRRLSSMSPMNSRAYEEILKWAVDEVLSLKDRFANNQYVRVSGFSMGIPSGVSIEFELR